MSLEFPYTIQEIDAKTREELLQVFKGPSGCMGFVQVSPQKYIMPITYKDVANDLYNFKIRQDDTWIVTFPRSGTTLMQELVWLINNDLDFERALKTSLFKRCPFIDTNFLIPKVLQELLMNPNMAEGDSGTPEPSVPTFFLPMLNDAPSPRFIKTHLPFSLLPPALLDTAKCVFVARNPKDVAVSYYHHNRLISGIGYEGDFQTYWNFFQRNLISPCPYWEQIREAWQLRDHPNLLFLFYEDIISDWRACIRKVATFFNKQLTDEQVDKLVDHMNIENFRNNPSVNLEMEAHYGLKNENEQPFIRKGENDGWKAVFTPEMNSTADKWIAENLARIPGFQFPQKRKPQ